MSYFILSESDRKEIEANARAIARKAAIDFLWRLSFMLYSWRINIEFILSKFCINFIFC